MGRRNRQITSIGVAAVVADCTQAALAIARSWGALAERVLRMRRTVSLASLVTLALLVRATIASAEVRYLKQRVKIDWGAQKARANSFHTDVLGGSLGIVGSVENSESVSRVQAALAAS